MNMMFQAISVWQSVAPVLRMRVVTAYKQLWSREAALTTGHGGAGFADK